MTFETRYFVELPDIVGFEFACAKCGVKMFIPVASVGTEGMPGKCPRCNESWTPMAADTSVKNLDSLMKAVQWLSSEMKGMGFKFGMQVKVKENARPLLSRTSEQAQ